MLILKLSHVSKRGPSSTAPELGPRFNIKMTSYQYRKSHCGDKTILRPSYLRNGISYTVKITSLYWLGALVVIVPVDLLAPNGTKPSAGTVLTAHFFLAFDDPDSVCGSNESFNSLAHGRGECNLKEVIFKFISRMGIVILWNCPQKNETKTSLVVSQHWFR